MPNEDPLAQAVIDRLGAVGGDSFGLFVHCDLSYAELCERLVPLLDDWESAVSADDQGYFEFTPPVLTPMGPAIGVTNLEYVDLPLGHIRRLFTLAGIDATFSLMDEPEREEWTYAGPIEQMIARVDLRAEPLVYDPEVGLVPLAPGDNPPNQDIWAWMVPTHTRAAVAEELADWLEPERGPVHLTIGAVRLAVPSLSRSSLAATLASQFPGRPAPGRPSSKPTAAFGTSFSTLRIRPPPQPLATPRPKATRTKTSPRFATPS